MNLALKVGAVTLFLLAILLTLAGILALGGFPVAAALGALVQGAFGSADAVLSATLVRATPLILTGLSLTLAFRAGVLNIGAEGQLLVGAAAAAGAVMALGSASPFLTLVAALLSASVAGAAWAFLPALLRRRFGVLEVISTIMMNFVAAYLVSFLVRGPMQEPTHVYPQSPSIPEATQLPIVVPGSRLHAGFLLALGAAACVWILFAKRASGYRIRAIGANPHAASSAGRIDVARTAMRVFVASGALAGVAGGIEVMGVTFALYENISPGYGYTAIAVALLAGLHPLAVVPSGLMFGALEAGAASMQRTAAVPAGFVGFIEAVTVLMLIGGRSLAPRLRLWHAARRIMAAPTAEASP